MAEIPQGPILQEASRFMTRFERVSVGTFLAVFAIVLMGLFVTLWPQDLKKGGTESLLSLSGQMPIELRIVLLVLIAGALGGTLHALRSYTAYAGNRELVASWTFWYLVRPLEGAIFAVVFYLLIRGGLLPGVTPDSNASVVGFAGAATLIGLFSDLAAIKLKEVFGTMFSATATDERKDKLGGGARSPRPEIHSVIPEKLAAGTTSPTISIAGKNLVAGTKITVDGEERTAKLEADGHLTVTLDPKDVETRGGKMVVATNPPPAGGTSEPVGFVVT